MTTDKISSKLHNNSNPALDTHSTRYLNSKDIEAPLSNIAPVLPDTALDGGIYIVDTSDLFGALEGEGAGNQKRGLKFLCRAFGIETRYLHNAGNDAHVRPPKYLTTNVC